MINPSPRVIKSAIYIYELSEGLEEIVTSRCHIYATANIPSLRRHAETRRYPRYRNLIAGEPQDSVSPKGYWRRRPISPLSFIAYQGSLQRGNNI